MKIVFKNSRNKSIWLEEIGDLGDYGFCSTCWSMKRIYSNNSDNRYLVKSSCWNSSRK